MWLVESLLPTPSGTWTEEGPPLLGPSYFGDNYILNGGPPSAAMSMEKACSASRIACQINRSESKAPGWACVENELSLVPTYVHVFF